MPPNFLGAMNSTITPYLAAKFFSPCESPCAYEIDTCAGFVCFLFFSCSGLDVSTRAFTNLAVFSHTGHWEKVDAYVEGGDEDFCSYVERLNHYWKVTQIEDDSLKKSAFITAIGKHPYKTLKDQLLPSSPEDKSFEDLVKVLKEHYAPGSQVIAKRFKFNRRYHLETETVSTFAVQLRHFAVKCAFGNFLDDPLRDRFIAVLRNPAIQAALLKKKELHLETARELARNTELAEKESRSFRTAEDCASTEGSVNSIVKNRCPEKHCSYCRNYMAA
ncbi:hypothetical protein HPB48_009409 [Haemaphysalis longicornis]|uniref:Tick transposon n=1 Tax=Haemaphysalis longicornis TaxID=44386 RepID=A0A9J6FB58_HAELO|nr:hypothetical protein HPB48_009409 [Haemaphysalis longicornis]